MRTEHVEIEKEVLVPVPEALTRQVDVPKVPESVDTLALAALYRQTVVRLMQANGQLKEIEKLNP